MNIDMSCLKWTGLRPASRGSTAPLDNLAVVLVAIQPALPTAIFNTLLTQVAPQCYAA
jgi:hypothetical protein